MNPNSPEFVDAFKEDFQRLIPQTVTFELSRDLVLVLVGQLQLALRHPANRGESANATRTFVDALIDKLGRSDILRRGLQAGDSQQFDVRQRTIPSAN